MSVTKRLTRKLRQAIFWAFHDEYRQARRDAAMWHERYLSGQRTWHEMIGCNPQVVPDVPLWKRIANQRREIRALHVRIGQLERSKAYWAQKARDQSKTSIKSKTPADAEMIWEAT